jgi:hypothetical protein
MYITLSGLTGNRRAPRRAAGRAAIVAAAVMASCITAACGQPGGSAPPTVSVTTLSPQDSPQGDYTVGVPPGWTPQPLSGGDFLELTQDRSSASIFILPGVAVSDLRYHAMVSQCDDSYANDPFTAGSLFSCIENAVQTQLQDSSYQWTPQQALQAVLATLIQQADFGSPQVTATSRYSATFRVAQLAQSRTLSTLGLISVLPISNSLLASGDGAGWTNVALLGACTGPPGQIDRLQAVCTQVLGSFHATAAFWNNLADQLDQVYQGEEQALLQFGYADAADFAQSGQLISQWGASMRQLQAQTYQAERAGSLMAGENAIAALGGNALEQDPSSGSEYSLPAGYGGYCLTATGTAAIVGDVTRGVDGCTTILRPVS